MSSIEAEQSDHAPHSALPPIAVDHRMQSAMVLFALEQSLGQYLTENTPDLDALPETLRQVVAERAQDGIAPTSVAAVVQSTYISEAVDAALAISRQVAEHPHLRRLKDLVDALRLYDIRNVVCHPNRPFPECYWHRMATIATDPAIESLQLRQVTAAFRAAQEGKIVGPPDTWFDLRIWAVPNNLPESLDHDITGLIGRTKETANFLRKLSNARFPLLALVGPGGTGKTALCLDAMHQCSRDPGTLEWADELLFVTAKSERLTARGVEQIVDPLVSFAALKDALLGALCRTNDLPDKVAFGDAVRLLRDRRVLLCIDNLESVLRDHPNAFDDFYAELPPAWRVAVTSRVVVNSATVIPVDTLTPPAAKTLCRQYLAKRGGPRLDESLLDRIVESCSCTPLAIRLVVDSYLAGKELDAALRTTRDNVIAFSYNGLVGALPTTAQEALECLFAANRILTRDELGDLLEFDADQVADGVTALIRTSLITRHTSLEAEQYSLSSSVRDLLLRAPVRPEIRGRVHERLRHQEQAVKALAAAEKHDPLAWDYVPEDAPNHVKAMVFEACSAVRRHSARDVLLRCLDRVLQQLQRRQRMPVLCRIAGYVYAELHDRASAIDMLRQATELRDGDLAASLSLAEYLREDRKLEDALVISSRLIADRWGDESRSSATSATRLVKVHWVVSIWLGHLNEAIEASSGWQTAGKLRPTLACIHVSATKRLLETCTQRADAERLISGILQVLDMVLKTDGYIGFVAHETLNALEQIAWTAQTIGLSPECATAVCSFVDGHLPAVCAVHRVRAIDDPAVIQWIEVFQQLDCGSVQNVLRQEKWVEALAESSDPALADVGYIPVSVYAPPKDAHGGAARSYLFARDRDGTEYYVPRRATQMSQDEFSALQVGDRLMVLPHLEREDGKAIGVRDVVVA